MVVFARGYNELAYALPAPEKSAMMNRGTLAHIFNPRIDACATMSDQPVWAMRAIMYRDNQHGTTYHADCPSTACRQGNPSVRVRGCRPAAG